MTPDAAHLRASDADRDRTAQMLRGHCQDGRLSVDELEDRLDATYAAKTLGDLAAQLADLPQDAVARPREAPLPARRAPAVGPPGRLAFTYRIELVAEPRRARTEALEEMAPALARHGYELVQRVPGGLSFARRRRPGWTYAVAVFGFPFGLFALLHTVADRIDVEFEPAPQGGTEVLVHGVAPLPIRRAFANLRD